MSYLLVTNDDGVNAPGILALTQAMRALGEVEVAAPAVNQSAGGHKKTLFQAIPFTNTTLADGTPALSITGSPADCIALCAMGLVPKWPPRLVVSGINRGGNMGQDITYSGTVTAALEATINGVPAVAVSLARRDAERVEDYVEAARVAQIVVQKALQMSLPPFTILNLNVPPGKVKGIRLVRQGVRIYHDQLEFNEDRTLGRIVGPEPSGRFEELGTDLWAVHQGYASLTPIHLDMTAHRFLAELAAWDITL
ncbi:MAG: 5'/3'-nucleotidase SurE [Anaerolineae bacterium]|jgi:5'-nucleotidase|nr:5'/3'-nucleotidase SurE [Anaerolineae bacterium]